MTIAHFRRAFGAPSETFIAEPILRLIARGVPNPLFTLLSLSPGSPVPHVAMATARPAAGPAIERRTRRLPRFVSKLDLLGWPIARKWLAAQLRHARPDVLISHFGPDGCLAAPVARRLHLPHVVFFYGYDVNVTATNGLSLWPPLYRRLFRSADAICTTSAYLGRRVNELGAPAAKQRVVYVGVDTSFLTYSNPAERFDGRTVRLLHIGRLTAKKSPLKLLRAVHAARAMCPERQLQLTIAGDGELAEASRALAQDLQLTEQVRFVGQASRARVRELLASHHLYTQYCETTPSGETEGLGVSFIEASAAGLPVIATRHNGIPEVVRDGETGLLSDEGDVDAMARNIAMLARSTARWAELGRAGRRHVEQTFTLDGQADGLLACCEAVRGRRRG